MTTINKLFKIMDNIIYSYNPNSKEINQEKIDKLINMSIRIRNHKNKKEKA
jgi:hypothetical protein